MLDATGWLRGLNRILASTTTTRLPDPDEPYDPELDEPWRLIMYCPHCGNALSEPAAEVEATGELADAAEDVAETVSTAEVEIARINADRDITLARIERGIVADVTEAQVAEDAVKAELLEDAMAPDDPEPVVVVADTPPDDGPAEEPPPEIDAEPEPAGKTSKNVWWR